MKFHFRVSLLCWSSPALKHNAPHCGTCQQNHSIDLHSFLLDNSHISKKTHISIMSQGAASTGHYSLALYARSNRRVLGLDLETVRERLFSTVPRSKFQKTGAKMLSTAPGEAGSLTCLCLFTRTLTCSGPNGWSSHSGTSTFLFSTSAKSGTTMSANSSRDSTIARRPGSHTNALHATDW